MPPHDMISREKGATKIHLVLRLQIKTMLLFLMPLVLNNE